MQTRTKWAHFGYWIWCGLWTDVDTGKWYGSKHYRFQNTETVAMN